MTEEQVYEVVLVDDEENEYIYWVGVADCDSDDEDDYYDFAIAKARTHHASLGRPEVQDDWATEDPFERDADEYTKVP
jgi:hypothetical protein